jgi:hypothetical protein
VTTTIRKGCDYSTGRPSIQSLKDGGFTFVSRYLSYEPNPKNLTSLEATTLRINGIDVVSNWEQAGTFAEISQGYPQGQKHAREAHRLHVNCGGPANAPIYFSTDFNPTAFELDAVGQYYRGIASIIGIERTGGYGGLRTIQYLFNNDFIRWGWQTYAWSGVPPLWDPRAQVHQVQNGVKIGGADCDIDYAFTDNFGQWNGFRGDSTMYMISYPQDPVAGRIWGIGPGGKTHISPEVYKALTAAGVKEIHCANEGDFNMILDFGIPKDAFTAGAITTITITKP